MMTLPYKEKSPIQIKFEIKCWSFPKAPAFLFGLPYAKAINISIDLDQFKSLQLATSNELPFMNYFITCKGENAMQFFKELNELVLLKYENVGSISISSPNIFNSELTHQMKRNVFSIPNDYNTKRTHEKRYYSHFFIQNSAFDTKPMKPSYFDKVECEYVGYTGKTKEEMAQGVELKCSITYEDRKQKEAIDYIFLKHPEKVESIASTGSSLSYFIKSNCLESLIEGELKRLATLYHPFEKIRLHPPFFNNDIIKSLEQSKNHRDFEKSIGTKYHFELTGKGVLEIVSSPSRILDCSEYIPGIPKNGSYIEVEASARERMFMDELEFSKEFNRPDEFDY